MRVAIYARVSTHDQQTLPMQLYSMREYADRRGWIVVREIQEVASGAKRRPARDELLAMARRREIDVVLVWRLDRWGRSLADLVATFQELSAIGVSFVSITEALDFTTPSGRAMAGMLAVFAEFERDILRDRVKAGIAEARKSGRRHGRPALDAETRERVRQMLARGISKRQIARTFGIGRATVGRIVTS